jgi:hypothetical protein
MVRQVKGSFRVRNVRLVTVVPIVHDLIKHFKSVDINWVVREHNTSADLVSKRAAEQIVGFDPKNPDFFKISFV